MTRLRSHWKLGLIGLAALLALGGAWGHARGPAAPAEAATATDTVTLTGGICNNVVLTWPTGTPLPTVAAAVQPASALESIWHQTVIDDRRVFIGWSPLANAPNDYRATEIQLDAVFICMRAMGTLERPDVMR